MAALQPGCRGLHAHPRPWQVRMHMWGRGVGWNCSKRLQAVHAALADGKPPRPAPPDMARWLPWLITLCSGGAVVVGDSVITFVSGQAVRSAAIKPTVIKVGRHRGVAAGETCDWDRMDCRPLHCTLAKSGWLEAGPNAVLPTTAWLICRHTVQWTRTARASCSQTTWATSTCCCCCARTARVRRSITPSFSWGCCSVFHLHLQPPALNVLLPTLPTLSCHTCRRVGLEAGAAGPHPRRLHHLLLGQRGGVCGLGVWRLPAHPVGSVAALQGLLL